ncbi:MAG: hypothetical protein ACRC7H_07610, partial [Plesiomonas shigelloides]
ENTTLVANNAAAVQLNTEQVAKNTQTVTTKTQQVSENAQAVAANTQAVTQMRDEVVAKTSMAQAAADTATQKAASAAGHDAAAAEYARQAQEAAQATAGALMDGGAADLSAGVYPQPVVVSGTSRPTFWKVTKGGTVGGIDYGVGDTLIYTVAGSGSYYKIDNTESVTSVQGEKGAVTLTPEKIGAEPAGTAYAGMQQHISAPDPHSQYAKKTEVEPKGTSASAITQHINQASVHPISGVAGLEEVLASKYSPSNQPIKVIDFSTLFRPANGWLIRDVECVCVEHPLHYVIQVIIRHPTGATSNELGTFTKVVSSTYIPFYSVQVSSYFEPVGPITGNRLFLGATSLVGASWVMFTACLKKL